MRRGEGINERGWSGSGSWSGEGRGGEGRARLQYLMQGSEAVLVGRVGTHAAIEKVAHCTRKRRANRPAMLLIYHIISYVIS